MDFLNFEINEDDSSFEPLDKCTNDLSSSNEFNDSVSTLFNEKAAKFILEKKIYSFNFKKFKQVKSIKNFKRDYRHLILDNGRYITEKEYLNR